MDDYQRMGLGLMLAIMVITLFRIGSVLNRIYWQMVKEHNQVKIEYGGHLWAIRDAIKELKENK